jgi:glycine C-acetyltransferase
MYDQFKPFLVNEIEAIKEAGLFKKERIITSAQAAQITIEGGQEVLNFCANNYLGLSSHPKVIEAAKAAIDSHGFGLSSVRFICGTQDIHKILEQKISEFLGTEDTILYAAAFDANGGVFEPLFGEKDAIISDALNHASIIDGVRLTKSMRYRYEHNSMEDLEAKLKEAVAAGAVQKIIVTDGAFSMDGTIAQLDKIVELAEKYEALVMTDECHSTGFLGKTGRGVHELKGVMGRVDIITGT